MRFFMCMCCQVVAKEFREVFLGRFSILPSAYFSLNTSEWFQWMDLWFSSLWSYTCRDVQLKLCNCEEAFNVLILISNIASLSLTLWKLLKWPNRTLLYLTAQAECQRQDKALWIAFVFFFSLHKLLLEYLIKCFKMMLGFFLYFYWMKFWI